MECGDVTPLWFLCLSVMECGDVTPLWFLCLAWQRAQKKNRKKQQKQRNQSGVTSPHSIKNANAKRARPANKRRGFMQAPGELQGRKKVRLRMRQNLQITLQTRGGQPCFVVKDPITLRYFHFDEAQRFILGMMDGTHTLEDIR